MGRQRRAGGRGNICSRGMPDHRHLQVEETHEEETSIPQLGWSWTIPRLDQIAIHAYQLHANLIEVIDQPRIQSQEKVKINKPCKHWVLGWSINKRPTYLFLLCGSLHVFFLSLIVKKRGMGRAFIYVHISDGTFPIQIQLGSRYVVWNVRDVADCMNEQLSNT